MKKFLSRNKFKIIGAALVIAIICTIPFIFKSFEEEIALSSYNLKLNYNDEKNTLQGIESVKYVNNSENAFSSLYFHLYPNAFREGANTNVVSSNNYDKAFPNGASYGSIDVLSVKDENDENLSFNIGGEDQNILEINLTNILYPEEEICFNIEFLTILPNANHRFGYGDNTINLGNFYPIACVYEDGVGFYTNLYHSNGDPFYSDVANYSVSITCNNDLVVASSGTQTSKQKLEDQTTYSFEGNKIRDFCLVLSKKFDVCTKTVDNVTINYFGYQGDNDLEKYAEFASKCVETYNDLFGKYPYKTLNVVKANFVHGGMEYPNLVMISDDLDDEDFMYVIAHEIAHQWWYGVVGNDEYNHAWIDEGLTEYSTYLFFEKNKDYGLDYDTMISNALTNYKFFVKIYQQINGQVDTSMDRALDKFNTEPEYVQLTYTKGVLLFDGIRESVGDKKFFKALKDLYEDYAYQNISPAELIASFCSSTGRNLENYIKGWINGEVVIA